MVTYKRVKNIIISIKLFQGFLLQEITQFHIIHNSFR